MFLRKKPIQLTQTLTGLKVVKPLVQVAYEEALAGKFWECFDA